jgi:hypothetical protein
VGGVESKIFVFVFWRKYFAERCEITYNFTKIRKIIFSATKTLLTFSGLEKAFILSYMVNFSILNICGRTVLDCQGRIASRTVRTERLDRTIRT